MLYAVLIVIGIIVGVPALLVGLYYAGLFYSRGYQRARRESLHEVMKDCVSQEIKERGN